MISSTKHQRELDPDWIAVRCPSKATTTRYTPVLDQPLRLCDRHGGTPRSDAKDAAEVQAGARRLVNEPGAGVWPGVPDGAACEMVIYLSRQPRSSAHCALRAAETVLTAGTYRGIWLCTPHAEELGKAGMVRRDPGLLP